MENYREVVESLEQGLEHIRNARDDSKYIQGIDGIVAYEELDRLLLLTRLAVNRLAVWEK